MTIDIEVNGGTVSATLTPTQFSRLQVANRRLLTPMTLSTTHRRRLD